jgi:PIN domain nuclease of toxin-antitoxin system
MAGRYLIDTQCFLWHFAQPERLNDQARNAMTSADSQLWLSIASGWEIAIKHALGKLSLPEPVQSFLATRVAALGCSVLPIELRHLGRLSQLPQHHRDPFDRMIVAQAIDDDLVVITSDDKLAKYKVTVVLVE